MGAAPGSDLRCCSKTLALLGSNRGQGRRFGEEAACTALIAMADPSPGGAPEEIKEAIVQQIESIIMKSLKRAPPHRAVQEHEWSPVLKPASQEWAG